MVVKFKRPVYIYIHTHTKNVEIKKLKVKNFIDIRIENTKL